MSAQTPIQDREIPVLIVGAGPVGLISSIMLSRQGIPHILVEKRGKISELPRARGVTVRSVEILSQMGLGADLEAIAQSDLWASSFVYTETLAGELIGTMLGSIGTRANNDLSPSRYLTAAQDRIDPLLHKAAASYPLADLHFETEVIAFEQDAERISATVRTSAGETRRIDCRYIIAADGGRSSLRDMAGIAMSGRADLVHFINNFVRTDLSRFTGGREGALIWTLKPGAEGVFQMLDEKERWAIQVQYDPATFDYEKWTDDYAKQHIRGMIGLPEAADVDIDILRSYRYAISMMIMDRFVDGRLLFAGDSAHQIPPYGGFGLNTGLQTAHNLVWKLAAILRGEAPPALLETFETERREIAERVCRFGVTNAGYIAQLMAAVRNAESIEQKRKVLGSSRQYGNWFGLDLGVHYEGPGAYVPDETPPPEVDDPVTDFVPHAKPGYRAPHFNCVHGGDRRSVIMLLHESFVLLAGPRGHGWIEAAVELGRNVRPGIRAYRVADDGDIKPEEADFSSLYGVGATGAVLVRPDGMVGFRATSLPSNPRAVLADALDQILRRRS